MTSDELEAGKDFGRYLDVDGDGIPYRTYPGTHPTKGAYFTRGTSRDRYAALHARRAPSTSTTCSGCCDKFETAQVAGPGAGPAASAKQATPLRRDLFRLDHARRWTRRWTRWRTHGVHLDALRVRAFPFADEVVRLHRRARDGVRGRAEPRRPAAHAADQRGRHRPGASSSPVLHYDGTPITARFIIGEIAERLDALNVRRDRRESANDLHRQAQAPSPDAADQRARLHAPRLRGRGLHALRRLRPRLRSARRSSRPASSSTLPPHRIAKLSGIGCSSKTPNYFLGQSHGFNSVHGRMPSVLTGANLANRDLIYLGVSGDGDSASIGLGQFAHSMRRGVNMIYIVENNGVYGLTKGQFSATADKGSKTKKGVVQPRQPHRPGRPGAAARRHLRRPQLLRRQGAAGAADQGRASRHKGAAFIDVHQPLRGLQQPRRLDQELRLCARAQRGGEPARRDHGRARRSPSTTRRATVEEVHPARRLGPAPAQAGRATTTPPTASRAMSYLQERAGARARSSPACSTSTPSHRPARPPGHGDDAAERAGRRRLTPGRRGAREDQRQPALSLAAQS